METENNNSTDIPKNGHELVTKVIHHPAGGVEALIRIAKGQETGWLEFKASTRSRQADLELGEKEDDAFWNVAKGAIALLNGWGGAVIIGITPEGVPVGWGGCHINGVIPEHPDQREDVIRKHIIRQVLNPKLGWDTGLDGHWRIKSSIPPGFINPSRQTYKGKEVIVLEVRPLPREQFPLWVTKSIGNQNKQKIEEIHKTLRILQNQGDIGKQNKQKIEEIHKTLRILQNWCAEEKVYYLFQRRFGEVGEVVPITDPDTFYEIKISHDPDASSLFHNLWNKFLNNIGDVSNPAIPPPDQAIHANWEHNSARASISVVTTHPKAAYVRRTLGKLITYQGGGDFWHVQRDDYVARVVPALEKICGCGCCPPAPIR